MAKGLFAGLLAVGVLACSRSDGADLAMTGGVASDSAAISDSTTLMLAVGTTVEATIQQIVSSGSDTTGEPVSAIVSRHVMDDGGHVVIPGGSAIVLTIARLAPAKTPDAADGVITLEVTSLMVGGTTYAPSASVGAVPHTLLRRGATLPERDVIVTPGTPIRITLTQPFKISAN